MVVTKHKNDDKYQNRPDRFFHTSKNEKLLIKILLKRMKTATNLSLLLLFITLSCQAPAGDAQETPPPNIVFLFTDDQTYTTIHALGNEVIQTPNLDRLAKRGTTFTHAYNMGGWNGAICVASRAMMISGRPIWRAQQQDSLWRQQDTTALHQTWGRLMAQQGYNTYMTGKWHVQAPADQVFDQARHVRPGMPPDAWINRQAAKTERATKSTGYDDPQDDAPLPGYNRPLSENDTSWSPTDTTFGGFWKGGKHWSEVVKDDAVGFIQDASAQEKPFFMYLAFNAPHDPRQAPQQYLDLYALENIPVPASFLPEYPWKDSIGNSRSLRDEALAPYPRTEYAVKKHRQEYYAIISHLDAQIGKILDALEASGTMDNTYIFFTADHGLAVGNHGLIGKQSLFDHSIRVPFIVAGPDIPSGKRLDQDVYVQDVMATSLELAGIEKPPYVEFNSVLDLANGNTKESFYPAIYGAYMDYQRMIRKDGYKLIVYPRINKVLLFDLEKDPNEITNLAEKPEQAERVKRLFNDLIDLQDTMGDRLDLSEIYQTL